MPICINCGLRHHGDFTCEEATVRHYIAEVERLKRMLKQCKESVEIHLAKESQHDGEIDSDTEIRLKGLINDIDDEVRYLY